MFGWFRQLIGPPQPRHSDPLIVEVVGRIPGVTITSHYRTATKSILNLVVDGEPALHRLCQLAALANAPLQVYEHSATELIYSLVLNEYSEDILLMMAKLSAKQAARSDSES